MNIIKEHINYLKDNPEGYWFKRKLYGWGWTPATKEGWFLFVFFLFSILYLAVTEVDTVALLIKAFIVTILFLFIMYMKGEPLKWQWGLKDTDEEKQ